MFVGPALVAKETRYEKEEGSGAPDLDLRGFHKTFLATQVKANGLAKVFNRCLSNFGDQGKLIPRISFLECSVVQYELNGFNQGVLVEEMIDPKRYTKWNNNGSFVKDGGEVNNHQQEEGLHDDLYAVAEGGSEDEQESDEDNEDWEELKNQPSKDLSTVAPDDVPQAFTHFTFRVSNQSLMVCDIQGVLDDSTCPSIFKMTDPAIHYNSRHGRKGVFGRSDRGRKGQHEFFKSHCCNALCRALGLPPAGTLPNTV